MQNFNLVDYIRQISELYRIIRQVGPEQAPSFLLFKETRDNLLKHHSGSVLTQEQKIMFLNKHLCYYDYNHSYRVKALFIENEKQFPFQVLGEHGMLELVQIGIAQFKLLGLEAKLSVFLIRGYSNGIFIPFKDKTNGLTTSRYGKYLYDTIRGADLGWITSGVQEKITLLLDFNYSYHPNCYYNDTSKSLLLPEMNNLDFKIEAGEKLTPFFTLSSPIVVSPPSNTGTNPTGISFSSTSTPTSPVAIHSSHSAEISGNHTPSFHGESSLSTSSSRVVEL